MHPNIFNIIGNFVEIPYYIKSTLGRNALRRSKIMSLRRPTAGGEFCFAEIFFVEKEPKIKGVNPNSGFTPFSFARHGRALTGESPEHAQIVGSV